jgi:YceI-like protein
MRMDMKRPRFIAAVVVLLCVWQAAAQMQRFDARSGSKVRMEGTSSVHDWQVEGKLIGGHMEVGPNFPTEPGQSVTPGKVEAKLEAFIPVRSMTSIEKDGRPYSTSMDDKMYEHMKADKYRNIYYKLDELTLKQVPKSKEAPYVFDATGQLAVAGVTNKITMPVNVQPLGDKKLKISGTVTVKMTSFGIEPPAPKIALGAIKTGDDVKLIFSWMVAQRTAPAASAAK